MTTIPDSVWELPDGFDYSPEALCDYVSKAWPEADCDEKCTLFDLAAGLYWYCCEWHGGQGSTEYSILSDRLDYHPGTSECCAADAGEAAEYVQEMIEQAEGRTDG
jgi:hypothetical protein